MTPLRERWAGFSYGDAWRALLIVALCGWIYFPALHGGWLWDDHIDVLQNPVIRDPAGWWKIWLAPTGWHFFPLKTTVQWIQWQLWQEHTFGYHVTSVALHALSALWVWKIFKRLGLRFAWLGGLAFAIHPLAVESVAWIAELKNTLSLPLALMAFDAWLDYREQVRKKDYVRALGFFVAAMLAKTSVAMFPVGLLGHAWLKRQRCDGKLCRSVLPFFAVSLALGLITVVFEHRVPAETVAADWSALERFAGAGGALGFYWAKAVFPYALSPVYAAWNLSPMPWIYFAPWLVLATVAVVAARYWSSFGRVLAGGFGFFVLSALPVLGLVPMAYQRIAWVADHFAYVPLLGVIGLVVAGLEALLGKSRTRSGRWVGVAIIVGVSGGLALESRRYARVFSDEETLWRHAVTVQPDAWLGHHDLAFLLARTGRADEAIQHYQAALRLKPDNAEAANNLGNALLATDRIDAAMAAYARATELRPGYTEAWANLSNAQMRAGRPAAALAAGERAVALNPRHAAAHATLGDALAAQQRYADAAKHYAAALAQRADDATWHHNYGSVLLQLGRLAEARAEYQAALRLRADYTEARVNLGYALLESGREAEAVAAWHEALRLDPKAVAARTALGNLYVRTGRPGQARAEYLAVLQQTPRDAEVRNNLAFALAQLGDFEGALAQCGEALRLRPDYAEARQNLARLRAVIAGARRP